MPVGDLLEGPAGAYQHRFIEHRCDELKGDGPALLAEARRQSNGRVSAQVERTGIAQAGPVAGRFGGQRRSGVQTGEVLLDATAPARSLSRGLWWWVACA